MKLHDAGLVIIVLVILLLTSSRCGNAHAHPTEERKTKIINGVRMLESLDAVLKAGNTPNKKYFLPRMDKLSTLLSELVGEQMIKRNDCQRAIGMRESFGDGDMTVAACRELERLKKGEKAYPFPKKPVWCECKEEK